MMVHSQDSEPHKRKRDADDNGDRIPQPPPPQLGNGTPINYLLRSHPTRLGLIQDDGEIFSAVLALIGDYEGVLSRHESLAANLGAKLTGPRLVKAMEGLFEGPITVSPPTGQSSVSWLDIIQFAKANPNDFNLVPTNTGGRICQFVLSGVQVEIAADDWKLIISGTLDRFRLAPPHPVEEDEAAELATVEIIEDRLQVLIKRADEVARKARQLNYHLSGRKANISSRLNSPPNNQVSGFQAVNQDRSSGSAATPYNLRADLLSQFLAPTPSQSATPRPNTAATAPGASSLPGTPVSAGTRPPPPAQLLNLSNRPSPAVVPAAELSPGAGAGGGDDPSAQYRPLITARIEKLARGEVIYPPCDRCRRLRAQCVKHLTACQGCTKKHAKCAWKGIADDEIAWLRGQEAGEDEGGSQGGGIRGGPLGPAHEGGRPESAGEGLAAAGGLRREGGGYDSEMEVDVRRPGGLGEREGEQERELGREREHERERERELGFNDVSSRGEALMRDTSMLSHMATVATAAAEARRRRSAEAASRRSSSMARD